MILRGVCLSVFNCCLDLANVLSSEYKHFYPYMIGVYMNNIKET